MTALEARKAIQAILGLTPDGFFGPKTRAALNVVVNTPAGAQWPPAPAPEPEAPLPTGSLEPRTERNIASLHPRLQPIARAFIAKAAEKGIDLRITSGTRTYAEQNALYEQGRTKPGKIVTSVRGGHSNHNFGIAFDVTIFKAGQPVWESPLYTLVGALGKDLGLSWGGDWKSFKDEPHFELRPRWATNLSESQMITTLRQRKEGGTDAFA